MVRVHPDVQDHEVRLLRPHEREELGGVACLADDLEPGTLEQARKAFPEQDVVVRERYARLGLVHRSVPCLDDVSGIASIIHRLDLGEWDAA
jgi:hypothetical protein